MIKEYITEICKLLNIKEPSISYDTSNFTTNTMIAQCSPDGSTIYLGNIDESNPDCFFSIAHELRHVWQTKTNPKSYFSDYKPSNLCDSIEEYNLQLAEVDANAFAIIIMTNYFHLQPQFEELSDSVKFAINERINIIVRSLE